MRLITEKVTLVEALSCMATFKRRDVARRFLEGLSTDELQYIAGFLGASVLDPTLATAEASRECLARLIAQYEWNRRPYRMPVAAGVVRSQCDSDPDVAHKMILLLEYLSISRLAHEPTALLLEGGSA